MKRMSALADATELGVGIIGASRVATYAMIAPARMVAGVRVAAIAARDVTRAAEYAKVHGIPRVHASYQALYADPEIDLVYISTPPACHAAQALAAIEAGKHVLVEKPFAMTAAEAARVYDAGQSAGVCVMEAMHSLHHPLFRRIERLIESGSVGDLRYVRAEFSVPIENREGEFRWQAGLGGGALMDLGVYPLAWCRRILGNSFKVLSANARFASGVDTAFQAKLSFSSSVEAKIKGAMVGVGQSAKLLIHGTAGSLEVINPVAPQIGHQLFVSTGSQETVETVEGPSTFEAQLTAVRDTLLHGAAFPLPANDFVHSMAAIEAIRSAWKEAGPGDLSADPQPSAA